MDEIRRFVQIDDYKRELYMRARESLLREFNTYGYAYICVELGAVLAEEIGMDEAAFCKLASDRTKYFEEMFPELIELFDGYAYGVDGKWESAHLGDAWFGVGMIEARIALIDFILTQ